RDVPGGPAMPLVIVVNGLQGVGRLPRGREAKYPLAIGQERAGPRILNHDRFAAGEVTHRAIADPGGLKSHVRRLGTTELAARALNVGLIRLRRGGDFARVPDPPAAPFEVSPFRHVPLRA